VTQTLRQLVDAGAGELRVAAGCARENPRREASLLLQATVGMDRSGLLLHGDQAVDPLDADRYFELVRHRARGLPLQLLIGETGFHDVMLSVASGVFIPRPETELLVEAALVAAGQRLHRADPDQGVTVLDLCTGTGAVAVALAYHFRHEGRVRVYAGDWNPRAVRLARRNAERNDVRVDIRRSNLFSAFADLEGRVDVLVSNPPYIAREEEEALPLEVRLGDPSDALFDPDGGTGFHRKIARRGRDFLRTGGFLAVEIGDTQGDAVRSELTDANYAEAAILPDLTGRDRVVQGVLAARAAESGSAERRATSTPSA
jgi:release factor glutamine methyltransferase